MKKNNTPLVIANIMGKWVGGGVESIVMNYYKNINRNNIQYDFIIDSDSTNIPYEEIKKLGGRVIIVPPYQKLFKYIKALKKIFKENNYKIVHSHINTLSVIPLYVAKKCKIPIRIAHSHSTSNKKEWKKNLLKMTLKPFSKVYATDYFACGEVAGKYLFGKKTFENKDIFILNNAIDLNKFKYSSNIRNKKRKEFSINKKTIVFGHVGRFVVQKNHSFLIDIFNEIHKKNPNTILILLGQGPLENKIKEKVHDLNLNNNVVFLGQRDDVEDLYQMFDVFLLPSLYEGLAVVGVEAQAYGMLCIFSDCVTKELQLNKYTKYISLNEHAKQWSNKILDAYKHYKRSFSTEINKKYDIKKESIKLEKKYLSLLKR